jgi:histidinol-phosphate aminotransferase
MSRDPLELLRDDLRGFAGYGSARKEALLGQVWLNANEAPTANMVDGDGACRRYPDPQPAPLRGALARLYQVPEARLLVGRGSDEGIDLLVRAFCAPGRDAVLTTPPVFGMYAVSARLQGAPLVEVPLVDGEAGFAVDLDRVAEHALETRTKLVFLCSPGNPTGNLADREAVLALARRLDGRALVVVDEAYIEFADAASMAAEVSAQRNLVVLRTLSKAHALAAARIGCVIADEAVIEALHRCQAPYPVPTPSADLAIAALQPPALVQTWTRVAGVTRERERMLQALPRLAGVRRVYPSQGNFLLVRCADAEGAFRALLSAGIVVRDQRAAPQLGDALRISIGTPEENDRVIAALDTAGAPLWRDQASSRRGSRQSGAPTGETA